MVRGVESRGVLRVVAAIVLKEVVVIVAVVTEIHWNGHDERFVGRKCRFRLLDGYGRRGGRVGGGVGGKRVGAAADFGIRVKGKLVGSAAAGGGGRRRSGGPRVMQRQREIEQGRRVFRNLTVEHAGALLPAGPNINEEGGLGPGVLVKVNVGQRNLEQSVRRVLLVVMVLRS